MKPSTIPLEEAQTLLSGSVNGSTTKPLRVVGPGGSTLRTVSVADVEMKSIEWLHRPLLQGAAFHLVACPKGVGKGTWLAHVTAAMTTGTYGAARNVLILSSEDSASIDLKPRLVAAG